MTERTATRNEADCKRASTLMARAALAGFVVHRTESDFGGEEFIASKLAFTKAFGSLEELEAWLDDPNAGGDLEEVA